MIDLHCHLLPGLDDGAPDLATSLTMARQAVDQGVTVIACTPHILPGVYHNHGPDIRSATRLLQDALNREGIALQLETGADVHMAPNFVAGLTSGELLTLADSRYVLVEPPHHVAPPQLEDFFFNLVTAGYVPILTHPERLSWMPSRYDTIKKLVQTGVWMQVTAGSFTGAFGRTALYWAVRLLDEGCVHLIASDAHDAERRPPDLALGRESVEKRVGAQEAEHLVFTRPMGILKDQPPSSLPGPLRGADADGESVEMPKQSRNGVAGRISAAMLLTACGVFLIGCAGSSGNSTALNNATAGYDSSGALTTERRRLPGRTLSRPPRLPLAKKPRRRKRPTNSPRSQNLATAPTGLGRWMCSTFPSSRCRISRSRCRYPRTVRLIIR